MRRTALLLLLTTPLLASDQLELSFDDLEAGGFIRHRVEGVQLRAASGHAEIDAAHARSGDRCLRLLGGEEHAVELRAPFAVGRAGPDLVVARAGKADRGFESLPGETIGRATQIRARPRLAEVDRHVDS